MNCINYFVLFTLHGFDKKHDLYRNCSYELTSQVTRIRTELVSMWTAAIEIHANSCFLEPACACTRTRTGVYV